MKRLLTATPAIVAGALFFGWAPAKATTISLNDNWSVGAATHTGCSGSGCTYKGPTFATGNGAGPLFLGIPTSNDGNIKVPLDNTAQTETIGTTGTNWLFVAEPTNTGSNISWATIPITFTLSDGTGSVMFTAYMEYFADAGQQQDDMVWLSSATTLPSHTYITPANAVTLGETSLVLTESLGDGRNVTVTLPYEDDWNMAQSISFNVDPVPEPASFGLFGLGLLGTLVAARRRRA